MAINCANYVSYVFVNDSEYMKYSTILGLLFDSRRDDHIIRIIFGSIDWHLGCNWVHYLVHYCAAKQLLRVPPAL